MGTRGAFGVIIGEKEKIGYNQFDSYPDGMGVENLRWLRAQLEEETGLDELIRLAEDARVVSDATPPTTYDVERLSGVTDLRVSEQSTEDWYCLTRETHGHIGRMLECGYILDNHEFPLDSLFCEWAYIVDLDAGRFEVYKGFQKSPPRSGRWAGRPTPDEYAASLAEHVRSSAERGREPYWPEQPEYYAVELAASWPLDRLPTDHAFLAEANGVLVGEDL